MAYLLTGFDFSRVGTHTLAGSDDGGAFSVSYTTGTYAHRTLAAVVAAYTAFATQLQTDMNTQSVGAGTYTVTWAAATGYTISYSAGNFSLTFTGSTAATNAGALLGFSANQSGATSYVSTRTPYYYLALAKDGPTGYSRPFEPSGQTIRQVSVNGTAYSVRPLTREKRIKMKLRFMTLAGVFTSEASATAPWAYEDLLDHVGAWEPILFSWGSPATEIVYSMVDPEFSEDARKPVFNDYHGYWDLTVEGQYLGAL